MIEEERFLNFGFNLDLRTFPTAHQFIHSKKTINNYSSRLRSKV